jgi:ubiquitin carboxyl-terminal hydrolase 5/13
MQHENIVATSPADPSTDFAAQMSKLATGVLSARYVPPAPPAAAADAKGSLGEEDGKVANLEKYVVAPRMFKHLVGRGHPEFSSGRQQDVSEYFQYLLEVMSKAERVGLPRIALPGSAAPKQTPSIFEYHVQARSQCSQSGEVKYSKHGPQTLFNMLELPVPLDKAVAVSTNTSTPVGSSAKRARLEEKDTEGDAKDWDMCVDAKEDSAAAPEQFVPFEACLQAYLAPEEVQMFSPAVGTATTCLKTHRFQTFPRYLMVKMARYYAGPNWVQVKINARIDVPEELDLTAYRAAGPQPDERLMAEDSAPAAGTTATAAAAAAEAFVPDASLVEQLMGMGFSANGCTRAAIATRNADAETAMNWIFEHMEDPDFNDAPVLPSAGGAAGGASAAVGAAPAVSVDPEALMMLTSMGYTEGQVTAALQATDNNIER